MWSQNDQVGRSPWKNSAGAIVVGMSPGSVAGRHAKRLLGGHNTRADERVALREHRKIGVARPAVGADRHADAGCGQDRNGWKPP